MMTRAKKNSFQALMKANIDVATRPGSSSGKMIARRMTNRFAPSVEAASSRSRGIAAT